MKKIRNISWAVFILSLLFLCGVLPFTIRNLPGVPPTMGILRTLTPGSVAPTSAPSATQPVPQPPPEGISDSTLLAVVVPMVTAVGSLITGVTTTVMSVRRDRLEARRTELELEKMRLEILKMQKETEIELAKKQRELDELKGEDKP